LNACVNELEDTLQQMIRKRSTFIKRTYVLGYLHAKQVACACMPFGGWKGLSHVSVRAPSYPATSASQDRVEQCAVGSVVPATLPEPESDTQPLYTETSTSVDDTHLCTQCDEQENCPDVAESVSDTEEQDSDESLGFEHVFGVNLQPDVTNDVPDLRMPGDEIDGWEVLPGTSLDSWCFETALQSA